MKIKNALALISPFLFNANHVNCNISKPNSFNSGYLYLCCRLNLYPYSHSVSYLYLVYHIFIHFFSAISAITNDCNWDKKTCANLISLAFNTFILIHLLALTCTSIAYSFRICMFILQYNKYITLINQYSIYINIIMIVLTDMLIYFDEERSEIKALKDSHEYLKILLQIATHIFMHLGYLYFLYTSVVYEATIISILKDIPIINCITDYIIQNAISMFLYYLVCGFVISWLMHKKFKSEACSSCQLIFWISYISYYSSCKLTNLELLIFYDMPY